MTAPSAKAAQQIARGAALQIVSEYKGEPLDFDFIRNTVEQAIAEAVRPYERLIKAAENLQTVSFRGNVEAIAAYDELTVALWALSPTKGSWTALSMITGVTPMPVLP